MGDSGASFSNLGQLLEKFKPQLVAMLERRIDPRLAVRIDPTDVLADVFLAARNRWPKFESQLCTGTSGDKLVYAWLYRLTRDTLIEKHRHHGRDKRDLRRDMAWSYAGSTQLRHLMKQGTSPSKAILRVELQEEVRRVVDLLKENEREVLWMHYEDQLSFAQIGLVLDISANAATLRHLRALKRLRELWNKLNAEGSIT